jgi:hypothetical protein
MINLEDAKNNVKKLAGTPLMECFKMENISESIIMVCDAACNGDKEARAIQTCIPNEMAFIGLYPHIMKNFDIKPEQLHKDE